LPGRRHDAEKHQVAEALDQLALTAPVGLVGNDVLAANTTLASGKRRNTVSRERISRSGRFSSTKRPA
jgi:hypothetical protein